MAQTIEGARKNAAARLGLTFEEYMAKISAGLKWCTGCKEWHPLSEFGKNRAFPQGVDPFCLQSRRRIGKQRYSPVAPEMRKPHGPPRLPARENDKIQARYRVNKEVKAGRLARPSSLLCTDCGHRYVPGGMRHEYHHYLGYGAEHHLDVQAVCTKCHRIREKKLGTLAGPRRKLTPVQFEYVVSSPRSTRNIARELGVCEETIRKIRVGKTKRIA